MMYQILCGHVNYALGKTTGARGTDLSPPFFSNFLFTNLFSIKFLYFFIISSLFPYFNLFVSIFIQSYVNIKLNVLSLKLMQWYVTSVIRGSLYEKFGNKCMKILKFWRTELSYAQNKNRGKKMLLLQESSKKNSYSTLR
jgi:hypothetical protein